MCVCFLFVYNLFLEKNMIKKIILILNTHAVFKNPNVTCVLI